ncbi:hypothetical protein LTR10_019762 [Elasticomyces elasticus]|uniref:D-xylose 1-dehydrogenase (NADP(+), D-xylono-1,5-lactone-forming) n=1 Tax=Exophiala sideris TaxID=1016849 RepID=A0ABR0JCR2_9EURO|nr:hypothetical protein LTR10_019762 [Elasticomyces elasticus]KAK5032111.1 hypothetical protein LTS07_004733 [Exophiala sideris]KAK5041038.1 hypothetical protein LTR13_003340 [Exophiala sideris]KAK5061628.1 hypothetical protein LTR69_004810 [Exophiala sideris]KAK5184327.1 hypothetical protein LTR44_003000 [Eurotiomycetes sp. CCFEE 6388]
MRFEKDVTVVRWGFMATGDIARTFARDILIDPKSRDVHDVVHVVAAAASSSSVDNAKKFISAVVQPLQDSQTSCKAYGSYEELVKDPDVDIIYISTPHSHHFQNCMLALSNRKAVVCEKPITVNADQAAVLYQTAMRNKCFLMEAVWTRFFPLSIAVRQLITDSSIGDVLRVYVNNSTGTDVSALDPTHRYLNKDLAGGALLDIGVYALTWLFQTLYHTQHQHHPQPPSQLASLVTLHQPSGTDQMVSVVMHFDMPSNSTLKEAHGLATTSMVLPDAGSKSHLAGPTVHIYGLHGEIQVWGPAHRAQKIKVIPKSNGEPYEQDFPIPAGGHGMFWEADAAARCWSAGLLECETIPWEESILVMKTVDEVRRQAGLTYPVEVETTAYPVQLRPKVSKA